MIYNSTKLEIIQVSVNNRINCAVFIQLILHRIINEQIIAI
jgi:hypothetical protein